MRRWRRGSSRSSPTPASSRLRAVRGQLGEGALRRPRQPAQGQGRDHRGAESGPEQPELHRRAEPAVALAALADRIPRAADVPRPRPARRRLLPDAGRHEVGADQEGRCADRATCARCCATRTSATPASRATATTSTVRFRDQPKPAPRPTTLLQDQLPDLLWQESADGGDLRLVGSLKPEARAGSSRRRSPRTSPRCTTASTSSASPSR